MFRTFRTFRFVERFHSAMQKNTKKCKEKQEFGKQDDQLPVSYDKAKCITIQVLAKPGAKQNNILGISSEGVSVQINAPPTEGEANTELVRYISSVLGLKKSNIILDKGFKSRSKTLKILNSTITLEEVLLKIEEEIRS